MDSRSPIIIYIQAFFHYWYLPVAAVVITAGTAAVVKSMTPASYEATALVSLASTRPEVSDIFNRAATVNAGIDNNTLYNSYVDIATGDELLQSVLNGLDGTNPELQSVTDLKEHLSASISNDAAIIRLTTSSTNPAEAAEISNLWADALVARSAQLFDFVDENQLDFLEQQYSDAQLAFADAEVTFVSSSEVDKVTILRNELSAATSKHASLLSQQAQAQTLQQDVARLIEQSEGRGENAGIFLVDELTALVMGMRTFGANTDIPITVQLEQGQTSVLSLNQSEQRELLQSYHQSLENKLADLDTTIGSTSDTILVKQSELQQALAVQNRITRDYEQSKALLESVELKLNEATISSQDESSTSQIVSRAVAPTEPEGLGILSVAALAGIVGLMLSVGVVLLGVWLQEEGVTMDVIRGGNEEVMPQPARVPQPQFANGVSNKFEAERASS